MAMLNQEYIPPALQCLTNIDKLLVKQKVELAEVFLRFETNNRYKIKNNRGEEMFYAAEDTGCCTRMCLRSRRPFEMKIFNNYRTEVIHLHRDFACDSCCFPCCLQKLQVFSPPGNLVGTVEQAWSLCTPTFNIKNESGKTVLKIKKKSCCLCHCCCCDVEFQILNLDGLQVGKISKKWSGLMREIFTDADFFGISFPIDLDVRMKAVMIGACFLIDFMYFEN